MDKVLGNNDRDNSVNNSQEKDSSIIQYMAKGALIIAVVFFHAYLYKNNYAYQTFNMVFCIFPCIMGVFFFYSGYNYTIGKRKPIDNIKRRTKQLLLPLLVMFFASVILVGGLQLITNNTDMEGIWQAMKYFLLSEGGVMMWKIDIAKANFDTLLAVGLLWYLYALYIVSVVFYLIVDKVITNLRNFIIVIVGLVLVSFIVGQFVGYELPYAIQSYPLILAVMLVGAYAKNKDILNVPLDNKKNISIAIVLMIAFEGVIFGLGLLCYYAFEATTVGALPGGALNQTIKGFDALVAFVMAILGTFVIHTLMRFLVKVKPLSFFFGILGKNVAIVYLTHPIFISYIHTLIFRRDCDVLGWFQPYMYTILTVALLVGIFVLAQKLKNKKKHQEEEAIAHEK